MISDRFNLKVSSSDNQRILHHYSPLIIQFASNQLSDKQSLMNFIEQLKHKYENLLLAQTQTMNYTESIPNKLQNYLERQISQIKEIAQQCCAQIKTQQRIYNIKHQKLTHTSKLLTAAQDWDQKRAKTIQIEKQRYISLSKTLKLIKQTQHNLQIHTDNIQKLQNEQKQHAQSIITRQTQNKLPQSQLFNFQRNNRKSNSQEQRVYIDNQSLCISVPSKSQMGNLIKYQFYYDQNRKKIVPRNKNQQLDIKKATNDYRLHKSYSHFKKDLKLLS